MVFLQDIRSHPQSSSYSDSTSLLRAAGSRVHPYWGADTTLAPGQDSTGQFVRGARRGEEREDNGLCSICSAVHRTRTTTQGKILYSCYYIVVIPLLLYYSCYYIVVIIFFPKPKWIWLLCPRQSCVLYSFTVKPMIWKERGRNTAATPLNFKASKSIL